MTVKPSVVCVGAVGVSIRFSLERHPAAGETVFANSVEFISGGKAANHAVGLAHLGASSSVISVVGQDAFAKSVHDVMAQHGVTDHAIEDIPGQTLVGGVITEDSTGDNRIVVSQGVIAKWESSDVDRYRKEISTAACCVVSLETPTPVAIRALTIAREAQTLTVLNPSPSPTGQSARALLSLTDVLILNDHEAEDLLGEQMPLESMAEALNTWGPRVVVLTAGAENGVVAGLGHAFPIHPDPVPPEEIVDSAGAGDAFLCGFVVRYLQGESLTQSADFAARLASATLRGRGFVEAIHNWDRVMHSTNR